MPDSNDRKPAEIDEFTVYRLRHIAKRFGQIYKKHGKKLASKYLTKENINPDHYTTVRAFINSELESMGLQI